MNAVMKQTNRQYVAGHIGPLAHLAPATLLDPKWLVAFLGPIEFGLWTQKSVFALVDTPLQRDYMCLIHTSVNHTRGQRPIGHIAR